jgi:pyruvate dehydrogenase E2 component (dihydrolipoamide acetyltransferase)
MDYFNLPDLGEGLQEAEIVKWHVKPGDKVTVDQLLVSVETAKAIVDIPSPQSGEVAKCFGEAGDTLQVGQPLVAFRQASSNSSTSVVGKIQESQQQSVQPDHFIIGAAGADKVAQPKALPAVRALAKKLGVDLKQVKPSRADGIITSIDVKQAKQQGRWPGQAIPLRGSRRTMAKNMMQSAAEVAQVTLFDDADIHAWPSKTDISVRLIGAIAAACQVVPQLNAHYDGQHYTLYQQDKIHLGIAVDTPQGLFVPVLRDIGSRSAASLRQGLDNIR